MTLPGHSREGAWIEIPATPTACIKRKCHSREGAWIEMMYYEREADNTPSHSREGAWIEILYEIAPKRKARQVTPVRERGLKCAEFGNDPRMLLVTPVRSVD